MSINTQTVRLADYQAPQFAITHNELEFFFNEEDCRIRHTRYIKKLDEKAQHISLHGEKLSLLQISLNDKNLNFEEYEYKENLLTIFNVPEEFRLFTEVVVKPDENTELSGLYRSNGIFCTQCEAEGFRRISFNLDRPDVLGTYRVRLEAEKEKYPVLLSNGNLEASGDLDAGRHFAIWFDPYPKPSYLFAVVAGNLAARNQKIHSEKGKEIDLWIYTEHRFNDQTQYAMQALIDAINWDERRFGFSYDLDRFNIVAVSDFNMGAMENKSLNIFNTKYVLADEKIATDSDYLGIQSVIGHEYFHNWTGDRITCRDWFQLSLKEGLTVFRDQEFSSDLNDRNIERIKNVNILRRAQFAEDSGPMRHPVQPQEYAAIDNFYTATVYEKGAEIIRMYHSIIGEEKFQEGMRKYVEKFDGKAARIEDFAECMQEVSGFNFRDQFFDWYTTSGTPRLRFTGKQNGDKFTLTALQDLNAVSPRRCLLIPIRLAFIREDGDVLKFEDGKTEYLWLLDKPQENRSFQLPDTAKRIPVLMLGFSAPVNYDYPYSDQDLHIIAAKAPDGFARNEAMNTIYRRLIDNAFDKPAQELQKQCDKTAELMCEILHSREITDQEKALSLAFPTLSAILAERGNNLDIDKLAAARRQILGFLAIKTRKEWQKIADTPLSNNGNGPENTAARALLGLAWFYLAQLADLPTRRMLLDNYKTIHNPTLRAAALEALNLRADVARKTAIYDFQQEYAAYPLAIDRLVQIQAKDCDFGALERIKTLAKSAECQSTNPNRIRALLGGFAAGNPEVFNAIDGSGYRFVCEEVKKIAISNPQLAARLISTAFSVSTKLDPQRKLRARNALLTLSTMDNLSVDMKEVLQRLLAGLEQ